MNVIDRIQKLLAHHGIQPRRMRSELSKTCGISYQAVSQWFSGETSNIKNDNLAAIVEKYGSTVDWLLTGKGSMISNEENAHKDSGNVISIHRSTAARDDEIFIPQFNVRAALGQGQLPPDYIETVRHITICESHLANRGISFTQRENLAVITGWGQSMEGTINDGDPVIIDRGISSFIGDGVYVFSWDNLLYIKRLQKKSQTKIELISDNTKYKDQTVDAQEIHIHAKVLFTWNLRKL